MKYNPEVLFATLLCLGIIVLISLTIRYRHLLRKYATGWILGMQFTGLIMLAVFLISRPPAQGGSIPEEETIVSSPFPDNENLTLGKAIIAPIPKTDKHQLILVSSTGEMTTTITLNPGDIISLKRAVERIKTAPQKKK